MLYIIAILLLILVLAIPAARNILFRLLSGALGLGLVGLVLAGLGLLGWWLWSIDWKALLSVKAPAAKTPLTFSLSNIQSIDVILALVLIGVVAYIVYDYRKLKK
jgi:hypothetical protein